MKKAALLIAFLLTLVLILPCVSGIAESAAAGQPLSYIDQDTFLSWLRTYDPEADITWEPWHYYIMFSNSKDVSGVSADLSDDQSTVLSASINVLNDIPKDAQSIINAVCKLMKDKLSSNSLKELKTGEWLNPKEVLSDGGKLSFTYDTRYVTIRFLADESELLPVDAFYKAAAVKKIWEVSITRQAHISKVKELSYEEYFSLPEEDMIAYSTALRSTYEADVLLDGAGRVTSIYLSVPTETNEADAIENFLQDAASRLVSGGILESVRSLISEKLSFIMDTENENQADESFDPLSFSCYRSGDHIKMAFTLKEPLPEDAAGFINGQIFGQD